MLEQLKWLGKKDEVDFSENKFRGKLAGVSWKYSQNIDGLIRVRVMIFVMALIVLIPVITNYMLHDMFFVGLLVERLVLSLLLVAAGSMFNKYRIASIILACLPIIVILFTYTFIAGMYDGRAVGFNCAILFLFLSGLYHDYKLKLQRKELEGSMLINQLISEEDI